ncbi:hypothetical protein Airi02_067000 [Actinoallomurus iriomotensis]|uniref:Uncharacterized protein n=1 Tax=Actinoallomurus iriomotensis TaxID=478107 RepID=A0A9W6S7V0_9ACTN|nr:hypothetical protein Airi02_067000 [Actinoallomurus iriomotensis]
MTFRAGFSGSANKTTGGEGVPHVRGGRILKPGMRGDIDDRQVPGRREGDLIVGQGTCPTGARPSMSVTRS